jgi:hypothetical protein
MSNENGSKSATHKDKDASASVKASTTKYRPTNQNIIRDLVIVFIPILVLYKLSTHPMIASIGHVDPNASRKLSQQEALANIIKNMALNKYKEKYNKRKQLLAVVDPSKCYDFTYRIKAAEDIIAKSNSENSNKRAKKKQRSSIKRSSKNHGKTQKKKMMQFGRKRSVSSKDAKQSAATTPVASSFLSEVIAVFQSSPKPTMKGAEHTAGIDGTVIPREKTKKKKFSFKRSDSLFS